MIILRLVIGAILFTSTLGKTVTGKFQLSSMVSEQYLSKFSFSSVGFISGVFTVKEGKYFDHFRHDLRIYLFNDVAFAKYKQLVKRGSLCRQRVAEASWSSKIAPSWRDQQQEFKFDTQVHPIGRTHYWYAIVADCWLEEYNAKPPPMEYELKFFDQDHGHLPADERGLLTTHFLVLLILVGCGVFSGGLLLRQYKTQDSQIHLLQVLVVLAYALQTMSVFCEMCHLWRYSQDGIGLRWQNTIFALDQLSSIWQSLSELIIHFVFVAVACGWTLSESMSMSVQDPNMGPPKFIDGVIASMKSPQRLASRLGPASLFFPVLAGVHLYLEFLGHKYDDDFNQFHDFEHTPGFLAIILRASLCALFLYALRSSMATPHIQLVTFFKRLRLAGVVWFIAFPVLVLNTALLPPYTRHWVVTAGSLILQTGALGVMLHEILTRSAYFEMSSLSQVGAVAGLTPTKTSKLAMD